jgi:hypothetical protein
MTNRRQKYLESKSGDLAGFAALLGDQFGARVNLLAQLIGDAHFPSLGAYKERLLMQVLRQYIPKRYSVGTGFVLFPELRAFNPPIPVDLTFTTPIALSPSHQCDILVYDAWAHPVVFEDGDFVVLRPEAVRAVVEVKSSLDGASLRSTLKAMLGFAKEWKKCATFYQEQGHRKALHEPGQFLLAWQVSVDASGKERISGHQVRNRIVEFYSKNVSKEEVKVLPLLRAAYVYNDYIVSQMGRSDQKGDYSFGYGTGRGKSKRIDAKGALEIAGDMTISSLLAYVQLSLESPFNTIFSYVDQTNRIEENEHRYYGYKPWLFGEDAKFVTAPASQNDP